MLEPYSIIEDVDAYLEPEQCPVCEGDNTSFSDDTYSCDDCGLNWIIITAKVDEQN